jgi:hypothetical protein
VASRSFRTTDSPDQAWEILRRINLQDAGPLPPFVEAKKTGAGSFSARGPFGTEVSARMSVRSDGRGGSIITEDFYANSAMPGMSTMAEIIHGAAIDPAATYERVKRRGR